MAKTIGFLTESEIMKIMYETNSNLSLDENRWFLKYDTNTKIQFKDVLKAAWHHTIFKFKLKYRIQFLRHVYILSVNIFNNYGT